MDELTNNDYYSIHSYLIHKFRRQFQIEIDPISVETITKSKNIDSIDYLTWGPNFCVFVGIHQLSKKFIAIKVLLKNELEKLEGSIMKRNFPFEKLYSNNGIARIYEIFSSGNLFFILADYHRENLAKVLINNGPLAENVAKNVFQGVLIALNYMHSNKIAHRNLKLENILLRDYLQPVLADYNYTIVVDNLENFEMLMATSLPYLAPEILSQVPYDPIVADVWSLGVCLFAILNDSFPFVPYVKQNESQTYKFKKHLEQILSESVKKCLKTMLEYDVNKRISTNSLIKNSWFFQ